MNQLINMLENGKSQFHVVDISKKKLENNGFELLSINDDWVLTPGQKYMTNPYSSMLVAWVMGENATSVRLSAAHTDFPMLKLKSNPEITKKGYVQINVELIPILATLESVSGLSEGERVTEGFILHYLADKLSVPDTDILDYDLYLYIDAKPSCMGLNDEFIAGARIDNISSVSAIIEALSSDNIKNCIAIGAFFDNEEIGSRSKQGADSLLLRDIVTRIIPDKKLLNNAFNMSVDVAHATHPNYVEKSDITNDIILGNGVVLKSSAAQKYVTDSEAGAVVAALSREKNVKIQRQVNRSGMPGGQTLGPIMAAYLPIKSVDIGIPMLAMHSACELAHSSDYTELVRLLTAYYEY